MANLEHSALSGAQLHENKGVAAASNNTVLTVTAGASVFKKLDNTNLVYGQIFHVQDQKAANTPGGTFTTGAWRTRTLNTSITNEITGASLASNQITLPAGTYEIEASTLAFQVDNVALRFQNVTDATTALKGFSGHANNSDGNNIVQTLRGRVTIAATKVFELQHQSSTTKVDNGFGKVMNLGEIEVYTDVFIRRIA